MGFGQGLRGTGEECLSVGQKQKTAEQFWQDLDKDPKDWATRLIFADWLEEKTDPHTWREPIIEGMRWMAERKKKFPFRPPRRKRSRSFDALWRGEHVGPGFGHCCTIRLELWELYKRRVEYHGIEKGRERRWHEVCLCLALAELKAKEQKKDMKESGEART